MPNADSFDELVESIRLAFFALRALSTEMLADLDCGAVERGILKDIEEQGPQAVPALAQARAVSRQAMQKAVDRLIERGLLAVEANPRHRRSSLLALTPAGKRLFTEIRARERRLLAKIELPVSDAELRRTTRVLRELGEHFAGQDRSRSRGT